MLCALVLVFRKFVRVLFYLLWLYPVWLKLLSTVVDLKVPAMIAYDVMTKVLDIEKFPQHITAILKSVITFIVLIR